MKKDRIYDYLERMHRFSIIACSILEDIDVEALNKNITIQLAVAMTFSNIGENAKKIMKAAPEFIELHPEISWHQIYGMRNRITHDYDSVDFERMWFTVKNDLPPLITKLDACLEDALARYGRT